MKNLEQLKELAKEIDIRRGCLDSIFFMKREEGTFRNISDTEIALIQWLFENGNRIANIIEHGAKGECEELLDSLEAVGKPKPEPEVDWCGLLYKNWPMDICDIHMMVFPSGAYHLDIVMKNEDDLTKGFEGATYQECAHKACKEFNIGPGV